jgi:Tol biopolymer transport system component
MNTNHQLFASVLLLAVLTPLRADGGWVAPGDNLVLEGVPPIPTVLADAVRPYTNFRGAGISSWHPTLRLMLIYTQLGDSVQIHALKFPGGARTQLTFFSDPAWDACYEPTHGDYFVLSKDAGGDENFQKYRFDLTSGKIVLLTDGKSRNTDGIWSRAGDQFVYGSTRRNGRDVDLWMMNPVDPKSDRMLAALRGGGWKPLDFSPDGRQVLAENWVSVNESQLLLIDVATGKQILLTPPGGPGPIHYGEAQFSNDGKGIFVTTDGDNEFKRLAYVDLTSKKHAYLTNDIHWDVTDFSLSFDGKMLAFVTNEEGSSSQG